MNVLGGSMLFYTIMFVSALIAVVISFRIGFAMAMKIKEIKYSDDKEHETKIQRFIEILTDFVDTKVVKSNNVGYSEPEMVQTIDGKLKRKNTYM